MKKLFYLVVLFLPMVAAAQENKLWSEADRQYLLENLIRSRDELIKETEGLSKKQWTFKELPDRWSVNEVVEHLAIWELLFCRDISRSLGGKPQPEYNATSKQDSYYTTFIMEEKPHISVEYTKPFTFTVPLGNNDIKNNIAWYLKMRNENIEYIKKAGEDLRSYYRNSGNDNIHQVYIYVFGHVDRHLRQIKKIKQHPNYPK
jgi:DinB superfamily